MGARRGAKTRDEAQSPGAAGPSFERLSLSVLPVRYERTMLRVCALAAYALRGFVERIHEYRVHRDRKDESRDCSSLGLSRRAIE